MGTMYVTYPYISDLSQPTGLPLLPLRGHVFTLPLLAHGFRGRPDANGADEFHALRLAKRGGFNGGLPGGLNFK